ncbi:hypothetical protein PRN20_00405 [Devosia sp. ZB163]|uniref:hypothetical protein n=1 Tax=Devosia sp. ZB163 TaxID=3025938 RepID=UPI002360D9DF|nr:hypothetical protein [Devosia sp. ZB163]MDC9822177.1 hypothetical protein [Devosia sp. ZB163]
MRKHILVIAAAGLIAATVGEAAAANIWKNYGSGNSNGVIQIGPNYSRTVQKGDDNKNYGVQAGAYNKAVTRQNGDGNTNVFVQVGKGNEAKTQQSGGGNTAVTIQVGKDNTSSISQSNGLRTTSNPD